MTGTGVPAQNALDSKINDHVLRGEHVYWHPLVPSDYSGADDVDKDDDDNNMTGIIPKCM